MNDNVLLDEDYKIYNKLISEYPDKKVYGLTKLKYYYEVLKQAKNKNMNTKDYLSFLGFTVDNKKQIIYSEDELINNLCKILHNKEYISIDYIKKNYPNEFDSIKHYSNIHNIKRCDKYLKEKGFFKTGKKTNNLSETFDSYSLSRLINEYDAKSAQLASALYCSRQHISKIATDMSTLNMNGWIQSYTDDEINHVIKIINNKEYFYKDENTSTTILICSNKLNFEKKAIVYIKNNFIKYMFDCDDRIEKALKDNYLDILSDTDFCLLDELNSLWNKQGNKRNNKYKIIEIDLSLRNRVTNISSKKGMTLHSFLKLFDYQLKDKRVTITDEALIKTIKKYIVKDNIVRIIVKDPDYYSLASYASKNNYGWIKNLVNHFGFEYQIGKDSSNVIEKHIKKIKKRYIVDNNLIYICSYDPFYNTLNALANNRHMDLQSLLKEWGFERIKHKYDLPKDYILNLNYHISKW